MQRNSNAVAAVAGPARMATVSSHSAIVHVIYINHGVYGYLEWRGRRPLIFIRAGDSSTVIILGPTFT